MSACRAARRALHLHHVERRDAFGDADGEGHAGIGGFEDGVGGEGRRDEDEGAFGAGLADGVVDGVEDGDAVLGLLAAAAGGDAGDDLRAVLDAAAGLEAALLARDPLDEDAGVLVTSTLIWGVSPTRPRRPTAFFLPRRQVVGPDDGRLLCG
jgi:hypothetical protein